MNTDTGLFLKGEKLLVLDRGDIPMRKGACICFKDDGGEWVEVIRLDKYQIFPEYVETIQSILVEFVHARVRRDKLMKERRRG